jgi:FkbM family methyltransferase
MTGRMIARLQSALSCSPLALKCVVKIRNQCEAIIGRAHGATVANHDRNGEAALVEHLWGNLRYFVDVGANRGSWTKMVLASGKAAAGLLFEPGMEALKVLRSEFASCQQVEIIPAALSDSPGEAVFLEEEGAGETSSLSMSAAHAPGKKITVRVTTLDAEIDQRAWTNVDFLKIDAERFDFHVLRGAQNLLRAERILAGQFEYGGAWKDSGSTLTRAFAYLSELGYDVYLLRNDGLYQPDIRFYGEYFGYSNYVFIRSNARQLLKGIMRGSR